MTDRQCLFAHTEVDSPAGTYPAYISMNRESDGKVTLSVRTRDATGNQQGSMVVTADVAEGLYGALAQVLGR